MTHADPRTSTLVQLKVGDVGFREEGKLKNLEKNLWSNVRTNNKLNDNPHMVQGWNQIQATLMRSKSFPH